MAPCKSSVNANGVVQIKATELPIVCKLQNQPASITIAEAEFFPKGSKVANPAYPVTGGQSFTISALPTGTSGRLYVRIVGPWDGNNTIVVVENCDQNSPILTISSALQKFGSSKLEVS